MRAAEAVWIIAPGIALIVLRGWDSRQNRIGLAYFKRIRTAGFVK